jgi:hypothetical protein
MYVYKKKNTHGLANRVMGKNRVLSVLKEHLKTYKPHAASHLNLNLVDAD